MVFHFRYFFSVQILVYSSLFMFSCSNPDLDKLSKDLKKKEIQQDINSSGKINIAPIAVISLDDNTVLKEDVNITFSAESSFDTDGDIVSYLWRDGNDSIGNEEILHKVFAPGVHIVELEVRDDKNSSDVAKKEIVIDINYSKIKINLDELEYIATLKADTRIINQVVIKENNLFAISNDGNIYSWELKFNDILSSKNIEAHKDYEVLNILIKNNRIYTSSSDNTIKIWDFDSKKLLKTIKNHTNTITSMVVNDNIIAISSLDRSISIISLKSNKVIAKITGHKAPIYNLAIIEKFLISYSSNRIIKIWDMNDNYKNINTIDLVNDNIDFMNSYKNNIITYSKNGTITIRDIFKNAILKEIKTDKIVAVNLYKNNILLALENNNIDIINLDTFKIKTLLSLENKATSLTINEGILAISLDNLNIKLFGNEKEFKKR